AAARRVSAGWRQSLWLRGYGGQRLGVGTGVLQWKSEAAHPSGRRGRLRREELPNLCPRRGGGRRHLKRYRFSLRENTVNSKALFVNKLSVGRASVPANTVGRILVQSLTVPHDRGHRENKAGGADGQNRPHDYGSRSGGAMSGAGAGPGLG